MSKLQEKPSALKAEHPGLKQMKFINFFYVCGSFLPSWIRIWIRIVNQDLDPDCESGSGCGSRDPIESGSNPDTDPDSQQCR
jgi:hypothetical protein